MAADGGKVLFIQPQPLVERPVVHQLAVLKNGVNGVAELEAAQEGKHEQERIFGEKCTTGAKSCCHGQLSN